MSAFQARSHATALPTMLIVAIAFACDAFAGDARPAPAFDARNHQVEYLGPGRELPAPQDLREIRIAFFGHSGGNHPDWGEAWRGAAMAMDEANASGGYRDLPFRLLSAWSESPWGSGVADLAKFVYEEGVWAILGGVDGTTTHLAEQIIVKSRLPLVSPGGTDPSVNFTNVAWMFTLPSTDDRIAPLLADAVFGERGVRPWSVVSTADRDARVTWRAFQRTLAQRGAPAPVLQITLPSSAPDYDRAFSDLKGSDTRVILILAGAREGARIVKAVRAAGFKGEIVGGAPFGRRPFIEEAGASAEGIVFPLLFDPESPSAATFLRTYQARWGSPPDFLAANAYDAMGLLIQAVRRSGPNRALIRDAIQALSPWPGVTGTVTWDATGRNGGHVTLGVWRGGRAGRR